MQLQMEDIGAGARPGLASANRRGNPMGATELSALLWREREWLELLVFKLEVQQLLLTAGRSRWIERSSREVEHVVRSLREASLARTLESETLAEEWGLPTDATLRDLADVKTQPTWSDLFSSHLRALVELTDQVAQLRASNEQLLRASMRSTQETIADHQPPATRRDGDVARFLDEDL